MAHDSQSSEGDYESSSSEEEQKDTEEIKEKGEFDDVGLMSDKDSEGSDHNPDKKCQNLYDILKFIGVLLY